MTVHNVNPCKLLDELILIPVHVGCSYISGELYNSRSDVCLLCKSHDVLIIGLACNSSVMHICLRFLVTSSFPYWRWPHTLHWSYIDTHTWLDKGEVFL